MCPPELYIFSDRKAFEFDEDFKIRARARIPHQPRGIYASPRPFSNQKHFVSTVLDADMLDRFLAQSRSLADFVECFALRQAQYRDREVNVFCKKTPININQAEKFCTTFDNGIFCSCSPRPGNGNSFDSKKRLFVTRGFSYLDVSESGEVGSCKFQ